MLQKIQQTSKAERYIGANKKRKSEGKMPPYSALKQGGNFDKFGQAYPPSDSAVRDARIMMHNQYFSQLKSSKVDNDLEEPIQICQSLLSPDKIRNQPRRDTEQLVSFNSANDEVGGMKLLMSPEIQESKGPIIL